MKAKASQSLLKKLGGEVVDFLLPPRCPACGDRILSHGHLCGRCWQELAPIAAPWCAICGLPFEVDVGPKAICGACMKEAPAFDWARAAVSYEALGRDLIIRMKHGGAGASIPAFVTMMTRVIPPDAAIDLIVPVPLHRWRLLKRRFNQSQLLAKGLAAKLQVHADPFVLERMRATPSQGQLDRKGRRQNVKGAFQVPATRMQAIEGKRVLLVDDVLTTGATASECARAFKKAGAAHVGVVAFARVGQPVRG